MHPPPTAASTTYSSATVAHLYRVLEQLIAQLHNPAHAVHNHAARLDLRGRALGKCIESTHSRDQPAHSNMDAMPCSLA